MKMGKASNGNSTTSSSATASEVVKSSWMTKRSQLKSRFSFTNYREVEHGALGCPMMTVVIVQLDNVKVFISMSPINPIL